MYLFPISLILAASMQCLDNTIQVISQPTFRAWPITGISFSPKSPPDSTPAPVGPTGKWKLIFSDEFNGTGLDSAKWHPSYPWGGIKGEERQEYVPKGVTLSDGALHLTAQCRSGNNRYNYTSGMIATWGKFNVTRGSVVEARVRVPKGIGLWPAIWLHASSGEWPPELDILEVRGFDPGHWLMTAHWADQGVHASEGFRSKDDRWASGWHTVTMQWDSTGVFWFIDGEQKGAAIKPIEIPNEPMYLIVNLAIGGGGWPGTPDSTTVFPATFDIDYVRIWTQRP